MFATSSAPSLLAPLAIAAATLVAALGETSAPSPDLAVVSARQSGDHVVVVLENRGDAPASERLPVSVWTRADGVELPVALAWTTAALRADARTAPLWIAVDPARSAGRELVVRVGDDGAGELEPTGDRETRNDAGFVSGIELARADVQADGPRT